ncbi:MAG: hypothetical protein M1450_05320 [Patescibacteria group bacterium]|nr:hypothetical protein [Patescibacteria group bacterium]
MYIKFKKHLGYYLSLLTILILGLLLTFLATPNIKLQIIIILVTIFFYVLWGILHHLINHELTGKIMVEYVLIGALGVSILFFILMGGLI